MDGLEAEASKQQFNFNGAENYSNMPASKCTDMDAHSEDH